MEIFYAERHHVNRLLHQADNISFCGAITASIDDTLRLVGEMDCVWPVASIGPLLGWAADGHAKPFASCSGGALARIARWAKPLPGSRIDLCQALAIRAGGTLAAGE
jgi:hypothetical protein